MSRHANEQRPDELFEAILQYVARHGLSDLSLRPLAKAVGSSPRVLLYYFGSKEELVIRVFASIRKWQRDSLFRAEEAATFRTICLDAWRQMIQPDNLKWFQLFFEAYGVALQEPKYFKGFLKGSTEDWIEHLTGVFCSESIPHGKAVSIATIVLGGFRGFVLDYCATKDRRRVERALELWIKILESQHLAKA